MRFARSFIAVAAFGAGIAVALSWPRSDGSAAPGAGPLAVSTSAFPTSPVTSTPASALHIDDRGLVSGQLDHVPLEWLFAELSRQGVALPGATPSAGDPSEDLVGDDAGETAAASGEGNPGPAIIATLRSGSEADRYDALRSALQDGIDVPQDLLAATFDAALSPRLDLLAFSAYVDAAATDERTAREALQRGLSSNSTAVRADAARRMTEFENMERASLAANQPTR